MGRKRKPVTKKKKEDFATCSFYCKHCDYNFDIEWETIWGIQECTHGYVGFHTNDTYVDCPKCSQTVNDNDEEDSFKDDLLVKDFFT
ncbi:hypothetical protein [Peribacillus acanthi]|uniref:hypothetical protein n=1 Tax=Peribacillus acanthi TaxID=2171554 RepID=UPI001F0B81D6|nr:hypothetical protein [Peribacillus acanthi]